MRFPLVTRMTAARAARAAYEDGGRKADANAERLADACTRAEATVKAVWEIHGTPKPRGLHSDTWNDALEPWTCTGCLQPWPCRTAQAIIGKGNLSPLRVLPEKQDWEF